MPNEENIEKHSFNKLTAEKQRKIASKGGKKSVQVRREKANFKRILTEVFEGKPSKPLIDILKQAGIESPDKLNYLEAIIAFGALKTHSKRTSLNELTRFLEFSRDSIGQKPIEKTMDLTPEGKQETKQIIDEIIRQQNDKS